jgi:hypothetical protein
MYQAPASLLSGRYFHKPGASCLHLLATKVPESACADLRHMSSLLQLPIELLISIVEWQSVAEKKRLCETCRELRDKLVCSITPMI